MYKGLVLIACLFICIAAKSQFSDNFEDGDFTSNPAWQGSPSDFRINAGGQLQTNNTTPSSTFLITTPSSKVQKTEWEFWIQLDFNTSSANYVDVWLVSQSQDLNTPSNSGYFIRIGSTDDDICLYKKLPGSSPQKIIDGIDGLLNSSSNTIKIKAISTSTGKWILLRDMTGAGISYRSEGETDDNSIGTSSWFGLSIRQSTSSFFQKHYFDDFVVKDFDEVTTQPGIVSTSAPAATSLKITFDRPLDISSAELTSHYFVSGIGNPVSATVDVTNGAVVYLNFDATFQPNVKTTILINGVSDVFGNAITNVLQDFYHYEAARYDVVIDEILADPSPLVGLPNQKFIELRNNAAFAVNLKGWTLNDGNSIATLPDIELLPDSFVIVTSSGGLDAYKHFGKTIAVSGLPSLNISGGMVALYAPNGSLMHAMKYDLDSYQNELKKEGGYSLEMINTKTGCVVDQNWIASKDPRGGTPGSKNSVDEDKKFDESFKVVNAYLATPDTLYVILNKSVDSTTATKKENYTIDGGLGVKAIEVLQPFFNSIRITLTSSASAATIYTITLNSLSGCDGSTMSNTNNSASFAIPETPSANDIVINEILFDPRPGGVDYVELYNNSNKTFDLKKLFIANRNSTGAPANFVQLSSQTKLLLPGKFALLTSDPTATVSQFPAADFDAFVKMNALPSFPDDSGSATIMAQQGDIIDEINYSKYWHFSLLKDREGVSLERISYSGPSNQTNFHSASTIVNGTPGYKNSQSTPDDSTSGSFSLTPEIFSPDNDGTDDFLSINYEFPSPGYVTNIKIFDASGRLVRYLEKNSLSSVRGYYRWDGLDDKSRKLPQGVYIIYFESFNDKGKKAIHKKTVVLARRW